jgi:hypothetical protein
MGKLCLLPFPPWLTNGVYVGASLHNLSYFITAPPSDSLEHGVLSPTTSWSRAAIAWFSVPPCSNTIAATLIRWERYGALFPFHFCVACKSQA